MQGGTTTTTTIVVRAARSAGRVEGGKGEKNNFAQLSFLPLIFKRAPRRLRLFSAPRFLPLQVSHRGTGVKYNPPVHISKLLLLLLHDTPCVVRPAVCQTYPARAAAPVVTEYFQKTTPRRPKYTWLLLPLLLLLLLSTILAVLPLLRLRTNTITNILHIVELLRRSCHHDVSTYLATTVFQLLFFPLIFSP